MPTREDLVIFDFTSPEETAHWQPINDVVMGGVSSSRIVQQTRSTALFTGVVSLDHGGGFASIRAPIGGMDVSEWEGVLLRVRGDGKTYKLNVMDEPSLDGPQFQSRFQTAAERWIEVSLPFFAFTPTFRGRVLEEWRTLRTRQLSSIGLMISDKQAGPFSLEIDWIKAYRAKRSNGMGES